jgi:nitrilase
MGVVAVVQAAPIWGDSMASSIRAAEAITEAAEAGAWLAAFPESYVPGAPDYADRFLSASPAWDAHENPGGSMIVDPQGTVVAGPLLNQEGILYADCDPATALVERRAFDAVGHCRQRGCDGER